MQEKCILIADDERSIRELIATALKNENCRIFQASNGKEAIEIARKHPIDLAILDIRMPEMDGIEALKQIRAMEKNIEVLMMTGYAVPGSLKEILYDYGARDYLHNSGAAPG